MLTMYIEICNVAMGETIVIYQREGEEDFCIGTSFGVSKLNTLEEVLQFVRSFTRNKNWVILTAWSSMEHKLVEEWVK